MAFWTKAAPKQIETDAPRQPTITYMMGGTVAVVKWNETIAAKAAMSHPIVYRALNKIAEAAGQVEWLVQEDSQATAEERSKAAPRVSDIQQLLNNPNPGMSAGMLRYWMALNFASHGRIPMRVTMSATSREKANGLYPLEASKVYVDLNERAVAQKYEYGTGDKKEIFNSKSSWDRLTADGKGKGFADQIWKPGLRGYQHKDDANAPLGAVALPAEVVRLLLIRALQTASGHPNVRYMVTCSRTLTTPQLQALKDHLNEDHGVTGPDAGKIPILQNASDIEIHTLSNDLSDIHSKMPSDDMARLIFGAFGIPIALAGMGAADGAKFSGNYSESRLSFWEDTMIPGYITPMFDGLTRMLCPPGLKIVPDIESVPALLAGRIIAMKEANGIMFLTTTEKRELFGYEKNDALPETPIPASTAIGNLSDPNNKPSEAAK